ncbi:MAG: 1-acylglycerol-3-phosphate O-acyltransferase [Chitinophagaceae bacterium]|nr:MAG: 1-acylglycerol-3-phosphate O-acyltransferase [Chitinophagaceae bacterium]
MKYVRIILLSLWRIWFYVLMAIPILILSPFLLVAISREKWYGYFFVMARIWAKFILFGMGFYYKIVRDQELVPDKSYMIVANHTSMADIMLMLAVVKNPFVFVGKAELAKIPVFGFVYKRTCILVDRNSAKSRKAVFDRAQRRLQQGLSICIFPEGGVPEDETVVLDRFKDGAFRLAIEHHIPVVPLSFPDNKKRFSFTFLSGSPGAMRARLHKVIETQGLREDHKQDIHKLREQAHQVIEAGLIQAQKKDAGQASF